jgi:hypothetical protein
MRIPRGPLAVPAFATAAGLALALGWAAYGEARAARVMQAAGDPSARGHFIVGLDFPPEAFHTIRMQAIGRVIEVRGAEVYMMDVEPATLRRFARAYWVREVRAWPGR